MVLFLVQIDQFPGLAVNYIWLPDGYVGNGHVWFRNVCPISKAQKHRLARRRLVTHNDKNLAGAWLEWSRRARHDPKVLNDAHFWRTLLTKAGQTPWTKIPSERKPGLQTLVRRRGGRNPARLCRGWRARNRMPSEINGCDDDDGNNDKRARPYQY